jgi:CBS domain containing-hemolysin-like protein
MIPLLLLLVTVLLTLFAYVDRLYTEMGKFFLRGVEDNLEVFEKQVEPALKMDRGRAGLTFALLTQATILILAVLTAYLVFHQNRFAWEEVLEALFLLSAVVVVFAHLIPHVLITRTRGDWIVPFRPLLRVASWTAFPAVAALSFSFTVAELAKPKDEQFPATQAEEMEALMDKGEEHGLLEQDDRKLIQSVVDFGDKTVREVMTPRPNVVAVERRATLEELLHVIAEKHFSRVPIYLDTLDHIEGFIYTRDLLQLTDSEVRQIRCFERMRPVPVVPETKKVSDLLKELQQQNLHLAIVVDEYGSVAGLATIEDLVEEIVGEIRDESDKQQDAVLQADGSYIVSGHAAVDLLENLFGIPPEKAAAGDATTLAGLVNTLAGHVPQKGETLVAYGLRLEVLESSERLVERLRITRG